MKLSKMRTKARAQFRRRPKVDYVVVRGRRFGPVDAAQRGYEEWARERILVR